MHILLTNDDGIYAEGIYTLYKALAKFADVTVVAPDSERSSIGHAITLSHPIRVKRVRRRERPFGYAISGTPADCVKFARNVVLKRKPDLVVSGINLGCNDGCSVIYSGTVAGAREGALMGVPSLAFSLATFVDPDFTYGARIGARLARLTARKGLPRGTFLNVNIPNRPANRIKGVRFTRQGLEPIHGQFRKRLDPNLKEYYWMTGKLPTRQKDIEFDTYALSQGYVTITPIQCDMTDHRFLAGRRAWKI